MAAARIKGVLSPVVTPFKRDLSPDVGRFIAHCKWLLSQDCGLAVFGTNSEANSMSAEERMGLLEAIVSAGVPTDAHDARHRRLLDQRGGQGQRARHQARRRGRADAAAVLLQGRSGGGAVPLLLGGGAAGRRRPPARLSLSHPAGLGRADHPQAGRAADEGLPEADRRHEGQLGRLAAHQEHDRRLRQGRLRRLLGQREAADRQHQVGRRRLHQRHRQHQSRARSPRPTRSTRRRRARSCRAGSTRCAASCRATS